MTLDVEVEGADTLARTLHRAADQLADGVDGADDDVARLIAPDARARTPRRTGALASTVTASGPVVSAGSPRVDYARFVHYGTSRVPARPFITDAATATTPRWTNTVRAAVARILSHIRGA